VNVPSVNGFVPSQPINIQQNVPLSPSIPQQSLETVSVHQTPQLVNVPSSNGFVPSQPIANQNVPLSPSVPQQLETIHIQTPQLTPVPSSSDSSYGSVPSQSVITNNVPLSPSVPQQLETIPIQTPQLVNVPSNNNFIPSQTVIPIPHTIQQQQQEIVPVQTPQLVNAPSDNGLGPSQPISTQNVPLSPSLPQNQNIVPVQQTPSVGSSYGYAPVQSNPIPVQPVVQPVPVQQNVQPNFVIQPMQLFPTTQAPVDIQIPTTVFTVTQSSFVVEPTIAVTHEQLVFETTAPTMTFFETTPTSEIIMPLVTPHTDLVMETSPAMPQVLTHVQDIMPTIAPPTLEMIHSTSDIISDHHATHENSMPTVATPVFREPVTVQSENFFSSSTQSSLIVNQQTESPVFVTELVTPPGLEVVQEVATTQHAFEIQMPTVATPVFQEQVTVHTPPEILISSSTEASLIIDHSTQPPVFVTEVITPEQAVTQEILTTPHLAEQHTMPTVATPVFEEQPVTVHTPSEILIASPTQASPIVDHRTPSPVFVTELVSPEPAVTQEILTTPHFVEHTMPTVATPVFQEPVTVHTPQVELSTVTTETIQLASTISPEVIVLQTTELTSPPAVTEPSSSVQTTRIPEVLPETTTLQPLIVNEPSILMFPDTIRSTTRVTTTTILPDPTVIFFADTATTPSPQFAQARPPIITRV
jgi:hypothetical protein